MNEDKLDAYRDYYKQFHHWRKKIEKTCGTLTEVYEDTRPFQSSNGKTRSIFPSEIHQLAQNANKVITQQLIEKFYGRVRNNYFDLATNKTSSNDKARLFGESILNSWLSILQDIAEQDNGIDVLFGFLISWDATGSDGFQMILDVISDFVEGNLATMNHFGLRSFDQKLTDKNDTTTKIYCPFPSFSLVFIQQSIKLLEELNIPQLNLSDPDKDQKRALVEIESQINKMIKRDTRKRVIGFLREKGLSFPPLR